MRVDGSGGGGVRKTTDCRDLAVLDAHVGAEPSVTRAIHHAGVADQEVVIGGGEGEAEGK